MNISVSNNVNSQNNKNWNNSFGGNVTLFDSLFYTLSKEDYFALQKLRKQRKGKVGDVRIWQKEDSFGKKYYTGTVDRWEEIVVVRGAREDSKQNESLIDFIKRMCNIADKTKYPDDYMLAGDYEKEHNIKKRMFNIANETRYPDDHRLAGDYEKEHKKSLWQKICNFFVKK